MLAFLDLVKKRPFSLLPNQLLFSAYPPPPPQKKRLPLSFPLDLTFQHGQWFMPHMHIFHFLCD